MFDNLIIFEMANSHQGNVEHGINIIKEMGKIAKKYCVKAAVKLQYRHYDTFIHPEFKDKTNIKHIPRFMETRLSNEDFTKLVEAVRAEGMITMSTPFDEESVDLCLEQDLDIIKIASCSAKDWPLLEKIATTGKPIIASTGGGTIEDIDNLYNFFIHKNCKFALLHCCALYPAPANLLQLDMLEKMKKRYPDITIGYSGHEDPNNTIIPSMAVAKGAKILERHVALPTETIKINNYSMTPEQADKWVKTIIEARNICNLNFEKQVTDDEIKSLESLSRGVYAKVNIKKGQFIKKSDVFFAMPYQEGQLKSGDLKTGIIATKDYEALDPIYEDTVKNSLREVRNIIHNVKGMLNEAGIIIGNQFQIELSHHYGLECFRQIGCAIINIVNREYCKKLIVMLPNQKHPSHYHKLKEETFQVLYGDMQLILNDEPKELSVGETLTVKRLDWHSFATHNGLIFEEISTTHYRNDSFYEDDRIAALDPMQRKTILENW